MTTQIDLAAQIATKAHEGQTRWDKVTPYISHPTAVANALSEQGYNQWVVATAWLHDVLEDTDVTAKDLMDQGVDASIVRAVIALTRCADVNYLDYILGVCKSYIACEVKIADIRHNMSDLKPGSMYQKYELALHILENSQ